MAVTHVSTTAYQQTSNATSHTISSYVVSSGSNRVLVLTCALEVDGRSVTTITRDGQSFTKKSDHTHTPGSGPVFRIEVWHLVNPNVSTANIVITLTGGSATFSGGVTQVTGAHQTTPLGTAVTSGAATANPSVTVADGATGDLVLDIVQESAGVATAGAGQTGRYDNTGLSFYFTHGSTEPGGASIAMSWTIGAGERHLVAINIFQSATDINLALSGSAGTSGHGTSVPDFQIAL